MLLVLISLPFFSLFANRKVLMCNNANFFQTICLLFATVSNNLVIVHVISMDLIYIFLYHVCLLVGSNWSGGEEGGAV